jgi:hypothetical protein
MVAGGPIISEQATFVDHPAVRNQMSAPERAITDELWRRGYVVLGAHPRVGSPELSVLAQIQELLDSKSPAIAGPNEALPPAGQLP